MAFKKKCEKCNGQQVMLINNGAHTVGCDVCKATGYVSVSHDEFVQAKINRTAIVENEVKHERKETEIPTLKRARRPQVRSTPIGREDSK